MAKRTKFFRVAVEGDTVDGRKIERRHIDEMAASYNPATYTARINCEHLRGFSPEGPFNSYGSVVALKADDHELELDGKKVKRRALYAQFDVTDAAVKVNEDEQKLFSSVEINPEFAGTGKAYLVGLAVTDNPASLGTEQLKFNSRGGAFLVSQPHEDTMQFEASTESTSEASGAFAAMKTFFTQLTGAIGGGTATPPVQPPVQQPANPPANDNNYAQLAQGMQQMAAGLETFSKNVEASIASLRQDVTAVQGKLDTTEKHSTQRPPATGGEGTVQTDC